MFFNVQFQHSSSHLWFPVSCLNDLLKLNNTNINKKYPVYLHFTLIECPHGLESFRWRKLVKIEVRDF